MKWGQKECKKGVRNTNTKQKNPAQYGKISPKKKLLLRGDLTPFMSKNCQI